jgi:hypothetical protein
MMSRPASKWEGRREWSAPTPANCRSSPPMAHARMNRPGASDASVPTCSATNTGFHRGRRYNAPYGRSPHSASCRPRSGEFC